MTELVLTPVSLTLTASAYLDLLKYISVRLCSLDPRGSMAV